MSWGSEYLHTMSWRDGIEKYMIIDSQLVYNMLGTCTNNSLNFAIGQVWPLIYPGLQCEAIYIGQVAKKDTLNDAVHIHCI